MEEREFNALADQMLAQIEQSLEACGADIDFELKDGGVLEITCESDTGGDSKIIVNRHTAAREIWVAARSGGFHFRHDGGRWIGTRDGELLLGAISRCLSEQTGETVSLS
ncbi:MAG TPA: iron donor protein CyaY [Rhodocyclaceae bacterium]|nr:iron donor protein CyaY [Rhodocyclaceae bacterium]